MAITNGQVANADEVICAYFKPQAIISNMNFMNSMKASGESGYTLIKGKYFTGGGNVTVSVYVASGCYLLQNINYTDNFVTDGNPKTVCPSCHLTICSTGNCGSAVYCISGAAMCNFWNNGGGVTNDACSYVNYNNKYADRYYFVVASRYVSATAGVTSLEVGDFKMCCAVNAIGTQCYLLQKVSGTNNCYEYFKGGASQCCVAINMASQGVHMYVCGTGTAGCGVSTGLCFWCIEACYCGGSQTVLTGTNIFASAPAYILVSAIYTNNDGLLKYNLLCCDNTLICEDMSFDTVYDVESLGLCDYKLVFYNGCCLSNSATGVCFRGYSIQGANRT